MPNRNIVLLTFDSLRADHCGYVGYDRNTTPNLDALATEGLAFTNAVSPASRTNPSMAGIFTGEPLVTRGKVSNPDHSKYHLNRYGTIAEQLSKRGYTTGAFCPNAYSSRYYGFDRGFDTFEDFLFDTEEYQQLFQKHLSESKISTTLRNIRNLVRKEEAFRTWDSYIDDMVAWADDQESPFFLWGFSLDTHFPYITPRKHRKWSNSLTTYYYNWKCNQLLDQFDVDISERNKKGITNIYDDSIQFADMLIGELRDRLSEYDPVFIVCADHGEAIGERDIYGHFYPSLYEENIRVPLVISGTDDDSEVIEKPSQVTKLPEILMEISKTGSTTYRGEDFVVSSTFDGRRNRNLISVKMEDWKLNYVQDEAGNESSLYYIGDGPVEPQNQARNQEVRDILSSIIDRRVRHEKELLSIKEASQNVIVGP